MKQGSQIQSFANHIIKLRYSNDGHRYGTKVNMYIFFFLNISLGNRDIRTKAGFNVMRSQVIIKFRSVWKWARGKTYELWGLNAIEANASHMVYFYLAYVGIYFAQSGFSLMAFVALNFIVQYNVVQCAQNPENRKLKKNESPNGKIEVKIWSQEQKSRIFWKYRSRHISLHTNFYINKNITLRNIRSFVSAPVINRHSNHLFLILSLPNSISFDWNRTFLSCKF